MTEPPYGIEQLHDLLVALYDDDDTSPQVRTLFIDTLMQFTNAIVLATTQATCNMLGIDTDDVRLLPISRETYKKLEASDMLAEYIDGKEETDD